MCWTDERLLGSSISLLKEEESRVLSSPLAKMMASTINAKNEQEEKEGEKKKKSRKTVKRRLGLLSYIKNFES